MSRNRKKKKELQKEPLLVEPIVPEPAPGCPPAAAVPPAIPSDTKALIGVALITQADKTIPVPFIKGDINIAEALALLKQLENYIMTRKMVINDDQPS